MLLLDFAHLLLDFAHLLMDFAHLPAGHCAHSTHDAANVVAENHDAANVVAENLGGFRDDCQGIARC
jgi:hypothetical protein